MENLESMKKMLDQQIDDFEIDSILKQRLIAVLRGADLIKLLKIDKNQSEDTIDNKLLEEYHNLSKYQPKDSVSD